MHFRNPPEVNYRAVRDMGLAAWFGSSLVGLGVIPTGVGGAIDDPLERHRVTDAAWKATRGLTAGAVTAYLVGVSLVRFDGEPLEDGVPRWITEGPESGERVALVATALAARIQAKRLRDRATEVYALERKQAIRRGTEEPDKAKRLRRTGHLFHAVSTAAVGALLYSHLKEDVLASSSRGLLRR